MKNHDLPKTTFGNSQIYSLKYNPNKRFELDTIFSLDKDISHSNYDLVKAKLGVNNFLTSFEFLEEDNIIGEKAMLKIHQN